MMTEQEAILLESLTKKNQDLVQEISAALAERDFLRLENSRLYNKHPPRSC